MKVTKITTTYGKEIEVSLEIGNKIRYAMANGIERVQIDPETQRILKISMVADIEDVHSNRSPSSVAITDVSRMIQQKDHERADMNGAGYKKFISLKKRLLKKL